MPNELSYGDNLDVLRKFVRDETVDLCCIDSPFNSKRSYNQIYNNIGQEDPRLRSRRLLIIAAGRQLRIRFY